MSEFESLYICGIVSFSLDLANFTNEIKSDWTFNRIVPRPKDENLEYAKSIVEEAHRRSRLLSSGSAIAIL